MRWRDWLSLAWWYFVTVSVCYLAFCTVWMLPVAQSRYAALRDSLATANDHLPADDWARADTVYASPKSIVLLYRERDSSLTVARLP